MFEYRVVPFEVAISNFVGIILFKSQLPARIFIRVLLVLSYRGFIAIASKDTLYWRAPDPSRLPQKPSWTFTVKVGAVWTDVEKKDC